MDIIKDFCHKNCENVDNNIFDIIKNDMEDGLDLLKITRNDIYSAPMYILVEKDLTIFLKNIKDYIYEIEICNIKNKIKYIEEGKWYDMDAELVVNIYLKNCSLILLNNNRNFLEYLVKTYDKEEYDDLLKYWESKKFGWLYPKFNVLNLYKIKLN